MSSYLIEQAFRVTPNEGCLAASFGFSAAGAAWVDAIADRNAGEQLAAPGFVQLAVMQPHPQDVQLRLAHRAAQAQQQAVMVIVRVVDTVSVPNQDLEQATQFEQLMPVLVRPRHSADLTPEDDADPA